MPLPAILIPIVIKGGSVFLGLIGVGGALSAKEKTDKANNTMKSAIDSHEKNIAQYKKQSDNTNFIMDELGRKELHILKSFEEFSNLWEKIQNRPQFEQYKKNGISIPRYNSDEIKIVSSGADLLLTGIKGIATGTAAGFAAAGASTSAVMAFGTASTGTAIVELAGVAATNATLATIGGGTIASGGGGIALGASVLNFATFGIGILVGGIIFDIASSNLIEKANDAWSEMKKAELQIKLICEHLLELEKNAKKFYTSITTVDQVFIKQLKKLKSIIEKEQKTDWSSFTKEEKKIAENTVLLVGLLYNMCKIQIVLVSNNKETNIVNTIGINAVISDSKIFLSQKSLSNVLNNEVKDRLVNVLQRRSQDLCKLNNSGFKNNKCAHPRLCYFDLKKDKYGYPSHGRFSFKDILL